MMSHHLFHILLAKSKSQLPATLRRRGLYRVEQQSYIYILGFPCGSAGKESSCNVGDLGSIPGLGRSPWRMERLPTPVFWPGEFHGLSSPWGHKESDMTEWLSLSLFHLIVNWVYFQNWEIFSMLLERERNKTFLLLCHLVWKSFSRVRLFTTPWTIQSMEFSRPEYWSE